MTDIKRSRRWAEGRKEGQKEGWKDGRKEGRQAGRGNSYRHPTVGTEKTEV